MLTVYRIDIHILFSSFFHYKLSARNKCLLISKSYIFAIFYRSKSRKKSDHANNRIKQRSAFFKRSNKAQTFISGNYLYTIRRNKLFKSAFMLLVIDTGYLSSCIYALLCKQFIIVQRRKCIYLYAVFFCNINRLCTYRTCRT